VQAHTLGKVGNLGTVLLSVYSKPILAIFIEIGPYLTDKEQKISWHSFFETRCIVYRPIFVFRCILGFQKSELHFATKMDRMSEGNRNDSM